MISWRLKGYPIIIWEFNDSTLLYSEYVKQVNLSEIKHTDKIGSNIFFPSFRNKDVKICDIDSRGSDF